LLFFEVEVDGIFFPPSASGRKDVSAQEDEHKDRHQHNNQHNEGDRKDDRKGDVTRRAVASVTACLGVVGQNEWADVERLRSYVRKLDAIKNLF